jgi:predicted flavoprotein YhiN
MDLFKSKDIKCNDFQASNCGILYDHSKFFLDKYKFSPIKNIKLTCGDVTVQGDILITDKGFEGTPVYTISNPLRVDKTFSINFKPDLDAKTLKEKIKNRDSKKSLTSFFEKTLNLNKKVFVFLREKHSSQDISENLFEYISNYKVTSLGPVDIDEAISTSGGVDISELTDNLELKKLKGHYVMGEMVDFDTITGGYLIQGCISMAYRVFAEI